MPCNVGKGIIVCGPGAYGYLVEASCPWCCLGSDVTVHAFREVFGGWCAPDLLCGNCGQYHGEDAPRGKLSDEKREENKAIVQALRDSGVTVGDWPTPSALLYEDSPEGMRLREPRGEGE